MINCNPDLYEWDWRLFEALSCAPLVMVDKMITPIVNPLIDKKHIIFYDRNNLEDLKANILFYLKNVDQFIRNKISKRGCTI